MTLHRLPQLRLTEPNAAAITDHAHPTPVFDATHARRITNSAWLRELLPRPRLGPLPALPSRFSKPGTLAAPDAPKGGPRNSERRGWELRLAARTAARHSHSIVLGGLDEMSSATRFTWGISLMIRLDTFSSNSYGSRAQSAVIASSDVTARITIGYA